MSALSWEQATWPVESGDEITHEHFEDIRKHIFLVEGWKSVGHTDIYTNRMIYTHANWGNNDLPLDHGTPGSPDYPSDQHAGMVELWFKNPVTGDIRRYANYHIAYADILDSTFLSEDTGYKYSMGIGVEWDVFDVYAKPGSHFLNCPVNIDGTVNIHWREIPDPNKYHHYDYNSNKWNLVHYGGNMAYDYSTYDSKMKSHYWLPYQTDPYCRTNPRKNAIILPSDYVGPDPNHKIHSCGCYRIYEPAEMKKEIITGYNGTQHIESSGDRNWSRGIAGYEPTDTPQRNGRGVWPNQISPISGPDSGHPFDIRLFLIQMSLTPNAVPWHWSYRMGSLGTYLSLHAGIRDTICSYQDRVSLTLDRYGAGQYLYPVSTSFIDEWTRRIKEKVVSVWTITTSYNWGDLVSHSGLYYACKADHTSDAGNAPDGVDGDDYWLEGVHQPNYFSWHPRYSQLGNELFGTNSSAFENVLKMMNSFDWYWDDETPPLSTWSNDPGWLNSTYSLRINEVWIGPPDNRELYPKPLGCWRRTWKWSFGRVKDDSGRFMKMWPSELGNPNTYFGIDPNKMVISSDESPHASLDFLYQVVDIQAMLIDVNNLTVEGTTGYNYLEIRHGPEQEQFVDEAYGKEILRAYETNVEMINEMRTALEYLKYVDLSSYITTYSYVQARSYDHTVEGYDSAEAAREHMLNVYWSGTDVSIYRKEDDYFVSMYSSMGVQRTVTDWAGGGGEPLTDRFWPQSDGPMQTYAVATVLSASFPAALKNRALIMQMYYGSLNIENGKSHGGEWHGKSARIGFQNHIISITPETRSISQNEPNNIKCDYVKTDTPGNHGGGNWVDVTSYILNQIIDNDNVTYRCISNHTSSSSREPGVGIDWETYWEEVTWYPCHHESNVYGEADDEKSHLDNCPDFWGQTRYGAKGLDLRIALDGDIPFFGSINWDTFVTEAPYDIFEISCDSAI